MPPITTAQEAVKIADDFFTPYYIYRRLISAEKTESTWKVVFNTGILLSQELAYVTLDSDTGEVIGYRSEE